MKKLVVPLIIAALVFAILMLLDGRHQMGREISTWRIENSALRQANAEAEAASQATIADLKADNAGKDEKIAQYVEKVSTISAKLTVVSARVEELQNAEPPTTPDIEALPIVINLRGQVAALTEAFDLSQRALTTQTLISDTLRGKVTNLEAIAAEWRGMYEREAALRANLEQGLGLYKKQARQSRVWKVVAKVGPPVAFVVGFIAGK